MGVYIANKGNHLVRGDRLAETYRAWKWDGKPYVVKYAALGVRKVAADVFERGHSCADLVRVVDEEGKWLAIRKIGNPVEKAKLLQKLNEKVLPEKSLSIVHAFSPAHEGICRRVWQA